MSRAQLHSRIRAGSIEAQNDGGRTYITRWENQRYVTACDRPNNQRSDTKKSKSPDFRSKGQLSAFSGATG
jgi:hypothetical protein